MSLGLIELVVILVIGSVFFTIFRDLFGPGWMRSQWRSHVREMQELSRELQDFAESRRPPAELSQDAACPACGAPVTDPRAVSPRGDVKCGHCGRWFSVKSR